MLRPRIIPCLLVQNGGLVKTQKFTSPKYVGDPINAVKIFNEKEVDEKSGHTLGYVHIPGMSDGPYRDIFEKITLVATASPDNPAKASIATKILAKVVTGVILP